MAQSAVTVTAPNPTPPTNLSFVGATPPLDAAQAAADDGYVVGTSDTQANRILFAAKTAAAGAGTSVDAEGRGAETSFTQTYSTAIYNPSGALVMAGAGPALAAAPAMPQPNQNHASSLSPATNPTLTSVSAGGASGGGNATCTATGVGFTRQSVLNINGINYPTTFTSSTTISASAPKKATAGSVPVVVITGGVVQTAPQNWTFT